MALRHRTGRWIAGGAVDANGDANGEALMRRANLWIAGASAAAGALALLVTVAGGGETLGFVLGAILLANAFVRYRLAQRW